MNGSHWVFGKKKDVKGWEARVNNVLTILKTAKRAFEEYKKENYDVIHFIDHEPLSLLLVWRVCFKEIKNVFFTVPAISDFKQQKCKGIKEKSHRIKHSIGTKLLAQKAGLILHAESIYTILVEKGIISSTKTVPIIPWGIDVKYSLSERNEARKSLNISNDEKVLLFAGQLRSDKGLDILLSALKLSKKDFKLIIAGPPEAEGYEKSLLQIIKENECEERVIADIRYLPEDEFDMYFQASDAVILPYKRSFQGGDSGILATACSFLCPLIATDVGVIGGKIESYGIGIICEPERPAELALAIDEFLCLSPARIDKLKQNIKQLVKLLSWKEVALKHIRAYKKGISGYAGI